MAHLLGVVGLAFVALLTMGASVRWPFLSRIVFVAFVLRMGASVYNAYIGSLPGSDSDAVAFEELAWRWAEGGFFQALQHFTGPDSYSISWVVSLFYSVTDRSLLMAQSVSLLFGMGTVVLGSLLARRLWGLRAAVKAGWLLAIFPTLILYSALVMREAYIWFFVLVALYGVAFWARRGNLRYALLALFGFLAATFFHGAMFIGALFFLLYVAARSFKQFFLGIGQKKLVVGPALVVIGTSLCLSLYVATDISLPKLGTFEQATNLERIMMVVERRTHGSHGETGASFPEWTKISSVPEMLAKLPARVAYFIYAPFPWDLREPIHLMGLLDGALYIFLTVLIWRNRSLIWADPAARAILLILVAYVVVFSFGVGNFGAGIRHRAKFVAGLIVLVAPLLPMLRSGLWASRRKLTATEIDKG